MQVIDILSTTPRSKTVGCSPTLRRTTASPHIRRPYGARFAQLAAAWADKTFTHAIVALSTNIAVRKTHFHPRPRPRLQLVNAIDPTVRLNRESSRHR